MPDLRPLREEDVEAVHELSVAAFKRSTPAAGTEGEPVPVRPPVAAHVRLRRLLASDPGGCWVAVDGADGPPGAALALVREGIWGLSLLVVRPGLQSAGRARAAAPALAHGAMRAAASSWLPGSARAARLRPRRLHSCIRGRGSGRPDVRTDAAPEAFVPRRTMRWRPPSTGRSAARPTARPRRRAGRRLLAFPGRGYVARRDGAVKLLAAADEAFAVALLRTVLARRAPRPRWSG